MTKFPEEQTPEKWVYLSLSQNTGETSSSGAAQVLLSVRQGSNVPKNLPRGKSTTGEDMELSGGCLRSQLAGQIVSELPLPT